MLMNNKQRLLVMCLELALECDKHPDTCKDCPLWDEYYGCYVQELNIDNIVEGLKECSANE